MSAERHSAPPPDAFDRSVDRLIAGEPFHIVVAEEGVTNSEHLRLLELAEKLVHLGHAAPSRSSDRRRLRFRELLHRLGVDVHRMLARTAMAGGAAVFAVFAASLASVASVGVSGTIIPLVP